uniref:Mr_precursor_148 n=1 Tax=Conus marmoreus TaxID=42752 RepID=U6C2E7_CONMR|nr:Mr_precursor_148 [Conus marmoreus]
MAAPCFCWWGSWLGGGWVLVGRSSGGSGAGSVVGSRWWRGWWSSSVFSRVAWGGLGAGDAGGW